MLNHVMIKGKLLEVEILSSKTPNEMFEVSLIIFLDGWYVRFLQELVIFGYKLRFFFFNVYLIIITHTFWLWYFLYKTTFNTYIYINSAF